MALTIEDGTGVAGANSYISVADAQDYADLRGLSVTITEALLIKACDYLEALRGDYQGEKTSGDNSLQWPRTGVTVDGFSIGTDEIPDILISAQAQLACDAYSVDLMPRGTGREMIETTVEGAVSVKYAQSGDTAPQPDLTAARALIAPLLRTANRGGSLRSVRV
jgi:hypothetical protein